MIWARIIAKLVVVRIVVLHAIWIPHHLVSELGVGIWSLFNAGPVKLSKSFTTSGATTLVRLGHVGFPDFCLWAFIIWDFILALVRRDIVVDAALTRSNWLLMLDIRANQYSLPTSAILRIIIVANFLFIPIFSEFHNGIDCSWHNDQNYEEHNHSYSRLRLLDFISLLLLVIINNLISNHVILIDGPHSDLQITTICLIKLISIKYCVVIAKNCFSEMPSILFLYLSKYWYLAFELILSWCFLLL